MKYGINIPNFGWFGDTHTLVESAVEAEEAGWDGFFLWDHMLVFKQEDMVLPFADPWISLAAIASSTKRIQLGPMITPLPRRRPWKVAREAVTLDHLSRGRLVLGVGLGAPADVEFEYFGEQSDPSVRACKLDESLDIIRGLLSGEKFSYSGQHYHLKEMTFLPKPKQEAGIPIWVGGSYPFKTPFHRAARYNGVVPVHSKWPEPLVPEHLAHILPIIESERGDLQNYDVVVCGETTGADQKADRNKLVPWIEAGVTWWLEDIHGLRADLSDLGKRIRAGPPVIA